MCKNKVKVEELLYRPAHRAGVLIPERFPHGGDRKARSYDTTLKEVGITRDQSSRWQQEASVPEMDRQQVGRPKKLSHDATISENRRPRVRNKGRTGQRKYKDD